MFLTFARRSPRLAVEIEMSLRQYFNLTVNLPTLSQAQLSPNILREVNRTVTAALEHEEAGNQAKRGKKCKYNASFTPEDRTAIWQYAAEGIVLRAHPTCSSIGHTSSYN